MPMDESMSPYVAKGAIADAIKDSEMRKLSWMIWVGSV